MPAGSITNRKITIHQYRYMKT